MYVVTYLQCKIGNILAVNLNGPSVRLHNTEQGQSERRFTCKQIRMQQAVCP